MESSNVEDPKAKEKVMQQISNSVPPEELPQVGKEYQKKKKHCDADMETEKESDTEKTPLINELQHGYRILCELMSDSNKAVNWPFLNAVDDSLPELEDYYERIPRPMWMKKMRISFEKREYKTLNEFVADFRLMLENCYRYNGPDSYISKRGQRLETMLGQKLALLPRNLREKTSILVADSISTSEEFALAAGLRRRTRSVGPQDSSALLNQLRQEEVIREKKARKQHMEERRAAQEAHVQEIIGWEDILLGEPLNSQMRAMWELPQIGHFLFLCQEPLYLAEVPQYELERCFLMARESTTMQRIMSSLLSTPHQRTKLYNHRHRMPYRIWEEKLQMKVKYWYDVLESFGGNVNKAADKLGLEPFAFEVMGKKNPLLGKKYHELGFYRKVWIMKSICDHVLEHQESLREAIELQPPEEQREYNLGSDAEGNVYIHFPQFCGADLRVYRHKPFPDPYLENEDVNEDFEVESSVKEKMETFSPVKKKHSTKTEVISEVISPPSVRPSRLRQNIKTILPVTVTTSEDDEEEVESNDNDYIEPLQKVKKRGRKKKYLSQSNITDSWVTSTGGRYKRNGTFRLPIYITQSKFLKFSENKDYFKRYKSANKKTLDCNNCNDTPNLHACSLHSSLKDFKLKSEKPTPEMSCSNRQNDEICKHINNVLLDNRQSNRIKQEVSSESSDCNEVKNEVSSTCIENVNNAITKKETLKNDQTGVNASAELVETKPGIFKREMKIEPSERAINVKKIKPLRSKRKYSKGLKRKTTSRHLESISVEQNESQENSFTNSSNDELICKTEKEETDVELEPEIGRFELIVDSVQDLRDLVAQFENPNSKGRKQKTKQPTQKKCVTELHARLTYLLKELEPWEAKLIQANQKARRKMKREQETYKEEMPKKELRTRNHQANLSSENNSKNGDSGQKAERGKISPSKSTSFKSRSTLTPVKSVTPSEDESPDVSSRGRLRKRRIIPNNVENELNIKKRKSTKTEENINTTVNKKVNHSKSKNSDMKIIEKATSKFTSMNKTTINQKSTNTANISPVPTCTVDSKSANLKQTSYPVIHQLLSNGQCSLDAAAQTEIKMFSSKGVLHSQNVFCNQSVLTTTANVIKQSNTTSVATTVNLSPKLLTPQTVSGNCSGQAGTGGKIQYYTQLSNLTPQIIQQLLRNATVSKSSSFESNMDNKGRTFVLSSAAINHPNNIVSPSSHTDQEEKSKKGTILISSTPITNPSETLTTSSTVITSASTGSKALFQNSNIHTVLPPQFQVLLRTSDSSTLVASSPKICKNQTKSSTKTQGPVYVISKHGVTSHILGAGSKLTTSLPVKTGPSSQAVQNTSGANISSTASFSLVNATVPSSVSFCKVDLLDNKSASLIHAVEQNKAIDSQLSSVSKNNLTRSPGKYACNITVKSLLESRVAKKTVDDGSENMQVNNGLNLPINQPVPVCNTSSIMTNAVIELHPTLSSSVNDSAHVAKNTCLLNTVKSQFSDVKTDQPAANLKMPASVVLPSFQPCKTITQTIQSTKTPITVTPHLMPTIESTKTNVLALNQANILQSFSSGSNLRANIPQPALLKQPTLMSLKQSTGQSVAFLQSGTSLTNSKNVILKVVPQNLVTPTTLGSEPSSNIVINVPKVAGQVNLPTRKIMQNELKQLGSLPQHVLTTVNPNGSKAQNTTVQSALSSKSLSTPALGLQITSSGIPLNMQKTSNQSILLLNPKDQNLQQQKTSIGVIPVQEQYNSKDLLKKVSTVQQIQGLSGPTLQIIPTQGNNTGLNNITTIQGQLLQSKNGNIILAHSTSGPSTGNITQLLHSSLNNHLTVTNIKKDVQCSVTNASPAVIQTSNVSSKTSTNIAIKGKDHLKTFKTIFSNTGASIKLKNDNTTSLHSNSNNLQIDSNNLSDGVAIDVSTCKNMITTGLSEQSAVSTNFALSTIETKHFNPSVPSNSPMSMVSPFVQPKLISPIINSQLATNTTQCVTQHSTLTTPNKSRSVSIQPSVPTLLSKSNETSIAITTTSSNTSIPPTQFHQNISLLSSSSHQSSSIIPQHISQGTVSTNSILVATSAPSSKDTDGTLTLKSTSSQPISVVPPTTAITDVSKIITKLSPQNMQTNFSQIKALGQTVPSSVKNKQSLLQQKLSPISNINQTKLQTVIPQRQAIVCQAPTTILSNNLISIGQTNTSNVNVPQLVLYSIGGQLVTPQGIPVTLENGVLKILTSPVATQNQVMLVQSPNPPIVGSSQIQTISTPYTDLLKTIKPSSSAGTILFSDSSLNTTISAPSAIDVPSQMTYAVPAQGILPSGTEFQQQYSPKVITNLENHVLTSCTQDPILENAVSTAQTHKVVATNVHNKAFLFTSPSTMVNKDIGTAKQHISPNLNDIYLKKHQSILCSNTKSANSVVLMDANNLQTKHSILYPVNMADTQTIDKPLDENVVDTHTINKSQLCTSLHQTREKEDSFEGAAILLSLARQPTMSSSHVDIDTSVVSYGELKSVNHHTQPE